MNTETVHNLLINVFVLRAKNGLSKKIKQGILSKFKKRMISSAG